MDERRRRINNPSRLLWVLLLAAVIGYFLYIHENPEGVRVGDPAPEFSLPSKHGVVSLRDLTERVILLNFWATWCPPCVSEMATLEGLNTRMQGTDFQLLAINVDEEGWAAVDRFLEKTPLAMTILVDPRGEVSSLYGTYQLPESFLIGRDGRVLKKYVGPMDWLDGTIVREIERYVAAP